MEDTSFSVVIPTDGRGGGTKRVAATESCDRDERVERTTWQFVVDKNENNDSRRRRLERM